MTAENFLQRSDFDIFTFGRPPVAIDIITQLKGLEFADAYAKASATVVEGLAVRLIHYQHLLPAKRAAGRPRGQNDLEHLQRPLGKKE